MEMLPQSPGVPSMKISGPEIKPPEAINFYALTEGNINLDTVTKVTNYLAINKNITDQDLVNLKLLNKILGYEIKAIKSDTEGIKGFLRYLFSPAQRAKQEQLAERMTMLRDFIGQISKAKPEKPKAVEENKPGLIDELTEVIGKRPKPMPVLRKVEKKQEEEAPPIKLQEQPTTVSLQVQDETVAVNIPPPPGGMPLPPPPIGLSKPPVKLTPEEQYMKGEQSKFERLLKDRATPKMFYTESTVPNEAKLISEQKELEEDIAFIKRQPNIDQERLAKKQQMLEKNKEALTPQKRLVDSTKDKDKLIFNEKIKKYTNEELKILIGFAFDGRVPETTNPRYAIYQRNRELMDDIFRNWDELSQGKSGQAFLPNQEEWGPYLNLNLFNTVNVLNKRLLPAMKGDKPNKDYLPEPSYEIKPFVPKRPGGVGVGGLKTTGAPVKEPPKEELSLIDQLKQRQAEKANKQQPPKKQPPPQGA